MAPYTYQGLKEFSTLTLDLVGISIFLPGCAFKDMEENKEHAGNIRREESVLKKGKIVSG